MKRYGMWFLAALLLLTGCNNPGTPAKGGDTAPSPEHTSATLTFRSFDGGGPTFETELDSDIVTCTRRTEYAKPNHQELDGAGFQVVFTFTGVKAGETTLTVKERSPIGVSRDHRYAIRVDGDLNATVEKIETIDWNEEEEAIWPVPTLVIEVNGRIFYADLADNPSAQAFIEQLSSGPIEVQMHDYGNFEKVGPLPWALPRSDETVTTQPGDVILYQGDQITIYYDENTWDFTRLAKIGNVSHEQLLDALGDGDATVTFWIEWSE